MNFKKLLEDVKPHALVLLAFFLVGYVYYIRTFNGYSHKEDDVTQGLLKGTELVKYIHQKTNGQIPIIASGGIFTGEDAKEKLKAGASLVQVWTGFIYEGPMIVKNICRSL